MKIKRFIIAGTFILCAAYMSGISYAWFTEYITKNIGDINAGYLHITFTGDPGDPPTVQGGGQDITFPSADSQTLGYTITNESPAPVIVRFQVGTLKAYIMPATYMKGDYVDPDYREILEKMLPDEKIDKFDPEDNPGSNVVAGVVLTEDNQSNDGWTFSGLGNEYLGKDDAGNQYFRLVPSGAAECVFKFGLSPAADNRYQYALLSLGEATALATQDNDDAFLSTFKVARSTVFVRER